MNHNHQYDSFSAWAMQAESSAPFVQTDDHRSFTYGEMRDITARYAQGVASLGVKPNDRVAVQVEKTVEALFLYIACLRVGAVYVPLNVGYTAAEMDYFIGDVQPALVVCRPQEQTTISRLCAKHDVRAFATLGAAGEGTFIDFSSGQNGADFIDCHCKNDDLAAIIYTSGTTGRSKGAMITHGNLQSNARTLSAIWRFTRSDVLIHALPLFHIHGLFVATNVVMAAGASMLLMTAFNPITVIAAMSDATVLMGVPTFYTRLLDHTGLTKQSAANMRLFVSGSAPLLADTHKQWFERTGQNILERYGMTETGIISSNPYDAARMAGTVGFPLPETSIRIVDGGSVVAPGEIGMIEVKGPGVFKGYWRMLEKTQAEFTADGFFITGDLGRQDPDGYLHIVGRSKDLVITGGYNVYPKEIETEIDLLAGVVESAVIGVPHPDFGEGVTAVVIGQTDEAAILAGLGERLAKYKIPKRVLMVDDLPRNALGKVQKNVLRQTYNGIYMG